MTWTVTKDGVSVTADTEAELAIAIAVLNTDTTVAERVSVEEVNAIGRGYLGEALPFPYATVEEPPKPKLAVVSTESDDSDAPRLGTPQHVTVTPKNREVLEAVMLFPEGVSTASLATLLGLKQVTVSARIQSLKNQNLVEHVPHHNLWRATTLARRAKLVTG
jgi:hypothetical protein